MPELEQLPSIAAEPISAVLLARNDEPSLAEALTKWATTLDKLGRSYEVLLVDDGPADPAPGWGPSLEARFPHLRVLRNAERRGIGAALRAGVAAARYPLLFYTECDRQYQTGELRRLLDEIDKVHLVSGYRRWQPVPGWLRVVGRIYRGVVRVLFNYPLQPLPGWLGWKENLGRLLVRFVFGIRLSDVNCAYRLIRRHTFARIPIQSDGPFAHVEILAKANFLGYYLNDEVPIEYRPPPTDAAQRPGSSRGVLAEACRVFLKPDFGPPVLPEAAQPTPPPAEAPPV